MSQPVPPDSTTAVPSCPKCGGEMWDNREGKRNPKAPDFKCKDRGCDGVIWPPRAAVSTASQSAQAEPVVAASKSSGAPASKPASAPGRAGAATAPRVDADGMPLCPVCGGPMWDDRASKRNPRAPDFKCRNKPRERGGPGCEGVIWPARDGSPSPYPPPVPRRGSTAGAPGPDTAPREGPPVWDAPPPDDDDVPF